MERETGLEPATSSLARTRSTTELLPRNYTKKLIIFLPCCKELILVD